MPRVRFIGPGEDLEIEVPAGTSLLEAALRAGAQVGHSCGGVCGCSSCHVRVRTGAESLSAQEDDELDRLDQAFDVRQSSRLACQARLGQREVEVVITEESLGAFLDEHPEARQKP